MTARATLIELRALPTNDGTIVDCCRIDTELRVAENARCYAAPAMYRARRPQFLQRSVTCE